MATFVPGVRSVTVRLPVPGQLPDIDNMGEAWAVSVDASRKARGMTVSDV